MFKGNDAQTRSLAPDVQFALPAPSLRPLITTYYFVATPVPLVDHLHPEWGNLRFTLSGTWTLTRPGYTDTTPARHALFGPSDRTGTVGTTGPAAMVGVGLTALGWDQLIGEPAHAHANRISEIGGLLGARADALHQQLLTANWPEIPALFDAFFAALAAAAPPPDPVILRAQAALLSGRIDSVPDFAAEVGVTERTLERLCKRVFGFTPKRLLRRQRFLRTLAEIGDRLDQPLSELLDGSYYDQSHFIREFRAYMGMAPLAYFNGPRQMIRRASQARMAAAGAPVQGLHRPSGD